MPVDRVDNKIIITDRMNPPQMRHLCARLYQTIIERGYRDIILDFSNCTSTTEAVMLPVIPIIQKYKTERNASFMLILPTEEALRSLFVNANWAHHIQESSYSASQYEGGHVPALVFGKSGGVYYGDDTLDRVIQLILGQLETDPESIKAVEWSLAEIMDNVTNHAHSPVGGFVQATAYKNQNSVEFVVADSGIGIPASMKLDDHALAVREAINEGITSDKKTNAGNGLYGSYRVAVLSGGQFEINSGHGLLYSDKEGNIHNRQERIPYMGTSVRCRIGLDDPELLDKALRFKGKPSDPPFMYVERKFEDDRGDLIFNMKEQAANDFGSRQGGMRVRNMIENLLKSGQQITLDFKDVGVITSSFADEVFGRLFVKMGPLAFMARIAMRNVDPTVQGLIDRAVVQRTQLGNGDGDS